MNRFTIILIFFIAGLISGFWFLNTPERYLFQSNTYLNNGKVAKALMVLEAGNKRFPVDSRISFALSRAYLASGEIKEANKIVLKDRLFKKFKDDTSFQDFLIELSQANLQSENEKYSKLFCHEYLENNNSEEISRRKIKNYIHIGHVFPERSLELWEEAYVGARQIKDAELKERLKALLVPKYFYIAKDLRIEKKYEEALEILQKARSLSKNAGINYEMAISFSELGEVEKANDQFEQAIQLDPENDNYKIAYADFLKNAAIKTKDNTKRKEYIEKIKLVLVNVENDKRKIGILNKIINLNAKYKITNSDISLKLLGDYFYPALRFKIVPVSETVPKKYKVVFFDGQKKQLDFYESFITTNDLNQDIEVICRNPVNDGNLISVKLFLNDEFVKEFSNMPGVVN